MSFLDTIKKILPNPDKPASKGFVMSLVGIACVVAYPLLKIYVASTPTKVDDQLLEKVHEIALLMNNSSPAVPVDPDTDLD